MNFWGALAALSTLGLLVLAVVGYFYTVRPVYQKDLLEEQTARMNKDQLALTDQLSRLNAQVAEAEKRLAEERVQAAQYKEQMRREENALREQLASETAAYLRQTNNAKARLAEVEERAARWSAGLKRREALHKHRDTVARNCVHDFASNPESLATMLARCMSVPPDLDLSSDDYALLHEWTAFYARNIATRLAVPEESSMLYGWAALRRDFPETEICWGNSRDVLTTEQAQRCALFKPMAAAITRAGDFSMALNEATRNIVDAVESRTNVSTRLATGPKVPTSPPLVVIR